MRPLALLLLFSTTALAAPDAFRGAAQKGLNFLASDTVRWQKTHTCYGCHVQAVTLEGLSVGLRNQYNVPKADLAEVLRGLLHSEGGARSTTGLSHSSFPKTSKTFGANALARYDALVDGSLTPDLLRVSKELVAFQRKDGAVEGDYATRPVAAGIPQATYHAAQTWRQAFARTADDSWLTPLRQAERYLTAQAKTMASTRLEAGDWQDLNYTLMGLLAAGASPSEPHVAKLLAAVEKRQGADGSFGGAFATGQTVYPLKLAGRTEADATVKRALGWLAEKQRPDSSWSDSGAGRAEAMWAVLGLVSVDVLSVSVDGLTDGAHVSENMRIVAKATDNSGAAVQRMELLIDDLSATSATGATLAFSWDTAKLSTGPHTVDIVATNTAGKQSRRRFELFAGDVFLTQISSRFTNEGTQITLRNIAPDDTRGELVLNVFSAGAGKPVFTTRLVSRQGPTAFVFGGKDAAGKPFAAGRYTATLSFVDGAGATRQTAELTFVHDSPEAQAARYSEVGGKLDLARDGSQAANAEVELVDDKGNVVQRARSNAQGQYRFKSLDEGKYKVRVKKDGFSSREQELDVKRGAPASAAPMSL